MAALAGIFLMGAARPATVDYSLSPVIGNAGLEAVQVEVRFTGEADGETRVRMPNQWAGETELWKQISEITVSGGKATAQSPEVQVIRHRPNARLTLRYRVVSGYPGNPPAGNAYRAIVRPTWFHLLGEAVFAEPEDQVDRRATFAWKNWPKSWTVASDLDHAAMGRRTLVGDVIESVSLGSPDMALVTRQVSGGTARVAVLGKWSFTADSFGDMTARIVDAQRGFWNDTKEPYFVSLIQTEGGPGVMSSGGTGRADAFAMFATASIDEDVLTFVIAHEHIHAWIPRKMGRMPREKESLDYWFSEGFTDFYTFRTLLRTGVWSLEDFARYTNESLSAYDLSKVRTEPNSRIASDFWKDEEVGKLPYQRGMQLAFHWDDRVRRATGGKKDLDDVLMLMRDRKAAAKSSAEVDFVRPGFVRAMKDVAGLDVTPDIARYVDAGEPVTIPGALFEGCATLVTEQRPTFARGWDPEATTAADNVVTGLKPESPAYAAGLRNGMKIIARTAGKVGDARVEYALKVSDAGTERTFRFMPEGPGRYTAREIVVRPGLDDAARKACAAQVGGA